MDYAIVKVGGHQEKVSVGDKIYVNHIDGKVDGKIKLESVFSVKADKPTVKKAVVEAKILDSLRGKKIDILKYKNKTGYRKRIGHRQELTKLEIVKIG
jgi:large subunit ribosomal protein L21